MAGQEPDTKSIDRAAQNGAMPTHTHTDGPYVRLLLLYKKRRSGRPCFFFFLLFFFGHFIPFVCVCVVRCWNVVNAMTPSTQQQQKPFLLFRAGDVPA